MSKEIEYKILVDRLDIVMAENVELQRKLDKSLSIMSRYNWARELKNELVIEVLREIEQDDRMRERRVKHENK